MGRGFVYKGSVTPPPQGGGAPALPILWGFPSMYAYTLCRRSTKFDVVTHVRMSVYLGVSHSPHPKESKVPGLPNFGVLHLCLHPLTHNDQIRHGNTYGEGHVLAQPRHCICTDASRGFSATAFFVLTDMQADGRVVDFMLCLC